MNGLNMLDGIHADIWAGEKDERLRMANKYKHRSALMQRYCGKAWCWKKRVMFVAVVSIMLTTV